MHLLLELSFEFDSKGLSFDQVLDKYFGSNTSELRAILRKAKNSPQTFSNLNEYHAYYDGLVNEVAGSRTLPEREKQTLILGFEVARNSGLYWYQARSSKSNPYHVIFSSGIQLQNFPCVFCGTSCEQLEDMLATMAAYEYYLNGGDVNASLHAVQDGQYHSGLAIMPGGACR